MVIVFQERASKPGVSNDFREATKKSAKKFHTLCELTKAKSPAPYHKNFKNFATFTPT